MASNRWDHSNIGRVTKQNAHPHLSYDGRFAVVHNGVITNHADLRKRFEGLTRFKSDTDSEIIAHLLELHAKECDTVEAIVKTTDLLEGEYALAILDLNKTATIYGAKRNSPLVLGLGKNVAMLSSDRRGLSAMVDRMVYLEDGEVIEVQVEDFTIYKGNYSPPIQRHSQERITGRASRAGRCERLCNCS